MESILAQQWISQLLVVSVFAYPHHHQSVWASSSQSCWNACDFGTKDQESNNFRVSRSEIHGIWKKCLSILELPELERLWDFSKVIKTLLESTLEVLCLIVSTYLLCCDWNFAFSIKRFCFFLSWTYSLVFSYSWTDSLSFFSHEQILPACILSWSDSVSFLPSWTDSFSFSPSWTDSLIFFTSWTNSVIVVWLYQMFQ